MSTKPRPLNGLRLAACIGVAAFGAACAGPAPQAGHSFSEVRLHRVPPPPAPLYLQAQAAPPAPTPADAAPRDPAAAADRVQALLREDGFTVEARAQGGERLLSATRMGAPEALRQEAACTLKAMRRPDFSASDLTVRLAPSPAGVAVDARGRFVLVDTNLISGDLTRQTCRSNGVLEAAVRRAAAG